MQDIIDVKNFLRSTRESGYRNLTLALAELVDNSYQAGSRNIFVTIPRKATPRDKWLISVLDDGCGMDAPALWKSLAFGGSDRYDDRTGLGRFGMGLPNSSLSQARRLEVYSWQRRSTIRGVTLDIDRILGMEIPALEAIESFKNVPELKGRAVSGTLVRWLRLDRDEPKSWDNQAQAIDNHLGRIFRHLIAEGLSIWLNGERVEPRDPLMCSTVGSLPLGKYYGEELSIEASDLSLDDVRSTIRVRFSELDVRRLSGLNAGEKRSLGIVGGAGVSIVRAGREIDYRWAFLAKRKENYDEWWRCEISFDPELDEAFGVTNTKQGIRPSEQLRALLTPQITSVARTLNIRARKIHADVAELRRDPHHAAVEVVQRRLMREMTVEGGLSNAWSSIGEVTTERLNSVEAFEVVEFLDGRHLVVNENHPFYQVFYGPLSSGSLTIEESIRGLDVLLLALAHQELEKEATLSGLLRLFFTGLR
jgi:hypothetical protein